MTTTAAEKLAAKTAALKTLRFGVEIETVGLSRPDAGVAVQAVVGGTIRHVASYDTTEVVAPDGRVWKLMRDGSLTGTGYGERHAELTTPILTYADLETLQKVVRALRAAGARVDSGCGLHIHVDGSTLDVTGLVNLSNLTYRREELLVNGLGIQNRVAGHFTKRIRESYVQSLKGSKPSTLDALASRWYSGFGSPISCRSNHYDASRYHGLNLHSFWFRGTVEFRYFSSTLHAGEVKAYVQLCLALVTHAKSLKFVKAERDTDYSKQEMDAFLNRMGLVGDEFKTCHEHLTKRLAVRAPAPAPVTTTTTDASAVTGGAQ